MAQSNVRLILHNSGWLLFDRVTRLALGVLVGAWVARYLGATSFGELAYAIAYIALFQTIATLAIDGLVVRDISRNPRDASTILGTAFGLRIISGTLTWLVAIGLMTTLKGPHDPYVLLSALVGSTLIFQAADVVDLWFQSQSQSRRTVASKLSACIFSNVLKVGLIHFQAPLAMFAAVLAVEVLLGALALRFVYTYFPSEGRWRFRGTEAALLVAESWPFILAAAVNMVQARIEFILIESMLGAAALGQYAAALRFIEIFDMIFISLATSIFPRISNHGKDRSSAALRKVYLLAVVTYLCIVPLLFLVWLLFGVIYGSGYTIARNIFPFMAIRPLLAYIGIAKSMAVKINSRSTYALYSSGVGALCAAAAAYLLVPTYGLPGAVFASLASYAISNVLMDAVFYRSNFLNMINSWREWQFFIGIIKGA